MRYLSVCSGIEAASVAWHPLGWTPVAFSEIEPFPCSVLAHRFPNVPNLGDMTKHENWTERTGPIDLLVGGTPCQAFSVAGLRKGLADPRGNLTLTFLAIAAQYLPRWIVWENVPGVLSDRTGAFGSFVGGLAELGYGWAYRILDAQYFGVAQRRRRVFVVGYLGDWSRAAAVHFEPSCLRRDCPPSREARKGTSRDVAHCLRGGGNLRHREDCDTLIPAVAGPMQANGGTDKKHGFGMGQQDWENGYCVPAVAGCLQERDAKGADSDTKPGHLIPVAFKPSHYTRGKDGAPSEVVPPLSADADKGDQESVVAFQPRIGRNGRGYSEGVASCLGGADAGATSDMRPCVAFAQNTRDEVREMPVVGALAAEPGMKQTSYIRQSMQVRRLTPRECERLQGFPDDWTLVPHRGKPAADGPRYKAIGNSMAVPVMHWIGKRIQMVEGLK